MESSQNLAELCGFVQCLSQTYRVKSTNHIFLKITSGADCFCEPLFNLLIQWPKEEEHESQKQDRLEFLSICRLRQWVRVRDVLKKTVYKGQVKEKVIWIYLPNRSKAELLPSPRSSKICDISRCLSQPPGLALKLTCMVVSVHASKLFVELSCQSDKNAYNSLTIFLLDDGNLLRSHSLSFGQKLKLYNVWFIPFDHPHNQYYLIVSGIYSSVAVFKSEQDSSSPSSLLHDYCSSYCYSPSFVIGDHIRLNNDVRIIYRNWLHSLQNECPEYKQPDSSNTQCSITSKFRNQFLDSLFNRSGNVHCSKRLLTEEFVWFPEFSPAKLTSDTSDFMFTAYCTSVAQLIHIYRDSSRHLEPTLPVTYQFNSLDTSVQVINTMEKQILPSSNPNMAWELITWDTSLRSTTCHPNFPSHQRWFIDSLSAIPVVSKIQKNESKVPIMGRLVWNAPDAQFHIQAVDPEFVKLFNLNWDSPTTIPLHGFKNTEPTLSVQLILENPSSTILPPVQSIVLLIDACLVCQRPSKQKTTSESSIIYLYAKEVINLDPDFYYSPVLQNSKSPLHPATIRVHKVGPKQSTIIPHFHGKEGNKCCFFSLFYQNYPTNSKTTANNPSAIEQLVLTGHLAFRWYEHFKPASVFQLIWIKSEYPDFQELVHLQCLDKISKIESTVVSKSVDSTANQSLQPASSSPEHNSLCAFCPFRTFHDGNWILWLSDSPKKHRSSDHNRKIYHVNQFSIVVLPSNDDYRLVNGFPNPNLHTIVQLLNSNFEYPTSPSHPKLCMVQSGSLKIHPINLDKFETLEIDPSQLGILPNNIDIDMDQMLGQKSVALEMNTDFVTSDWLGHATDPSRSHGPVHVRACIVRFLEFQCYRPSYLGLGAGPPISLRLCLRFIIDDGSGQALVQFGNSYWATNHLECQNQLELARTLFGLDKVMWIHLMTHLNQLTPPDRPVIIRYQDTFDLNQTLSRLPSISNPLINTLQCYLNSPRFLRSCLFHLESAVSSKYAAKTLWRFKQIRPNVPESDIPHPRQPVYFVLKPYGFYNLLDISSD